MQRSLPEFQKYNAQLLSLSPILPELSAGLKKKYQLDFEILSDIGNTVAKKYGLVFTLAESLQPIYNGFGIDIPSSNGDDSYTLPLPATYIIDKSGIIKVAAMEVDYTLRLDPEDIISELQKL